MDAVLGIDIAKAKFDVALQGVDGRVRRKSCANSAAGFRELETWLRRHGVTHVHACLEATGTYGEALATWLYALVPRETRPLMRPGWGYSLLGATVAIVYTYTAIAKMDRAWLDGHTLLRISSVEIREALQEPVTSIVNALRESLEETPPELAADIVDRGIFLTGGGALLRGLDMLLREVTNLTIRIADDPLTCVVRGSGKALEKMERLPTIFTND